MDSPYNSPDPYALHLSPPQEFQSLEDGWDYHLPPQLTSYDTFVPESSGAKWWDGGEDGEPSNWMRTALSTVPLQQGIPVHVFGSDIRSSLSALQQFDIPVLEYSNTNFPQCASNPLLTSSDETTAAYMESVSDRPQNLHYDASWLPIRDASWAMSNTDTPKDNPEGHVPSGLGNTPSSTPPDDFHHPPSPNSVIDTTPVESCTDLLSLPAQGSLTAEEGTYASRNPDRMRQPPSRKRRNTGRMTEAEKASRALKQQDARAKRARLNDEVSAVKEEYEMKLATLAKNHGRKVDYVQSLAQGTRIAAERPTPSTWNALSALKAEELNGSKSRSALFAPVDSLYHSRQKSRRSARFT